MKILIFDIYFVNMDISLIIAIICLRIGMYIPKIYMEGRVSQIFDVGFIFSLLCVEDENLKKYTNNHKSYPFFVIK